ncbi:MAG TPA: tripartite tricarboxylate transporter substrate binding protein, partial [Burkholderiaceae bacterium]|nr:tripartite tricarboxylate transporter substrate binding protein [Burkholderiaceae bacterium]
MRISLLFQTLAAGACALLWQPADAQSDVARQLSAQPFTIVAPFPPGGPVDTLSRMLAAGLTERY